MVITRSYCVNRHLKIQHKKIKRKGGTFLLKTKKVELYIYKCTFYPKKKSNVIATGFKAIHCITFFPEREFFENTFLY